MYKYLTIALLIFVVISALHPSPVPKYIDGEVVVHPDVVWLYKPIDGSFIVGKYIAGCLPWKSCRLNEPTDWWIVFRPEVE